MNPSSSVPYRIEYTRNRHSRAVLKDDTIVIRLAKRLTKSQEQQHIENLLKRMQRLVEKHQIKNRIDPFRPLLTGVNEHTVVLDNGTSYYFTASTGTRTSLRWENKTAQLRVNSTQSPALLHRYLWKKMAEKLLPDVETLVIDINNETLQVPVSKIKLRLTNSQWGSCSSRGNISLNTALLFLPYDLIEYVIIHELAHRVHHNHSTRFWNLVAKHCPYYEERKRELKMYRLPKV